jgi:hypothetical protein
LESPVTEARGYNAAEYRAKEQERFDAQIVTERCALCPKWSFTGPSLEGREKAAQHRAEAHPEIQPKRRRRGHLNRFRQPPMSKEEEAEVRAERLRRARLIGTESELDDGLTVKLAQRH